MVLNVEAFVKGVEGDQLIADLIRQLMAHRSLTSLWSTVEENYLRKHRLFHQFVDLIGIFLTLDISNHTKALVES